MTPVPRRHVWKREDDGSIDTDFGLDPHNGPQCGACGKHFCIHCEPDRWEQVLNGEDAIDCIDWHDCVKPEITSRDDTFTCSEPDCGKTYVVRAHWVPPGIFNDLRGIPAP